MLKTIMNTLLITTVIGVYGVILPKMVSSNSNELTILGIVIIIGTVVGVGSTVVNKLEED